MNSSAFRVPRPPPRADSSGVVVLLVAALLAGLLTGSAAPQPVRAAGAVGIVVRHGDGRLRYAYVPFAGESITGAEALRRANFALNVQASGTLGVAVCKIEGEGCDAPREDCFCRSYGDPAFYWHYYTRAADGTWRSAAVGAGNRTLRDGDVDGWSWTANAPNLPPVTLAEIATLTRGEQPASSSTPTDSRQPTADSPQQDATTTPAPATAAPTTPTAPANTPTAVIVTIGATPPVAAMPPAVAPTLVQLPAPTPTTPPPPTPADLSPRAAVVAANGTVTPLTPTPQAAPPANGEGGNGVGAFALVAGAMLLLVAVAPRLARRGPRR